MIVKSLILLLFLFISSSYWAQIKSDSLKEFTKTATAYSSSRIQKYPVVEVSGENLGEVLQRQTASFIKTYGMGGISTLSIRGGSANQTNVYWNGIISNSPTLGQSDLSLIPVEFIENASLNPGSAAAFDGVGGIAGSIAIKSSNSFHKHKKLVFSKSFGSFNADNTHVKLELGNLIWFSKTNVLRKLADNNFEYKDYAIFGAPSVERVNAKTSLQGVQQRLGFKHKASIFNVTASYIEADREIPVAIGVGPQDQFQSDNSLKTALEWRIDRKKAIKHLFRAGFIKDYLRFENRSTRLKSDFNTQIRSLQYHTTIDLKKGWKIKSQFIGNQFYVDSDGFESNKRQNRISGFINLHKKLDKWNINLAARELIVDGKWTPIAPTAGISYTSLEEINTEVFLNVGQNYNHPSLNDLYWAEGGNPDLLPEVATQLEIGTRTEIRRGIKLNLTGFVSKVDNWIQWTPQQSGLWEPQNVKNVLKRGGEVHVEFTPKTKKSISPFMLFGNYQYLIAESVETYIDGDQSVGKDLIYTPRHSGNININYRLKNIVFNYSQSWSGKLFLDRTNTTYLPYSAPANLEISKTILDDNTSVKFNLGIYNLYNEIYQMVANQPLPGRYFKLGFTLRFYE